MPIAFLPRVTCDLAIVTINFNSASHTIACVQSILSFTDSRFSTKVVVIDNNSEDDDFARLKPLSEDCRVILHRNPQNVGFASGNMLALHFVSSRYVFFLNNDCILQNKALSILWDFMQENSGCAMCCGLLTDSNGQPVKSWDYLPDVLPKIIGKAAYRLTRRGEFKNPKITPLEPQKVEVISGSQMFVRTGPFYGMGGFDCNFFLYSEEEDLAYRMKKLGLEVWVVPKARVYHLGGGSTHRSLEIRREFLISLLYFYQKNYGFWLSSLVKCIYALRYAAKFMRDKDALNLSWFIIRGPHLCDSLKHKQRVRD